ncbi:MAG: hypothetical protein MJZ26_10995 [Fibrobacter sp.]|nr:hypothetical protein [Fibrobacter sp.]
MKIRKLITKCILMVVAFLWAGCSDDESSDPVCLYGAGPVFDESSSSVSSSSEEFSSPEIEAPNSSSSLVDREAALARGETLCAEHNGVREMIQYEPPWGSPESRADGVAREEVRDSVEKVLKTSVAKKFSFAKRSCLEKFAGNVDMVVLYGAPMPAEENPYDIWQYICKNGVILKDEAYQEKDREYDKAFDEAKKESLERYRKEVDDCGKS